MDVQRTRFLCIAQEQTARPVLVVRVVLDYLADDDGLSNFLNADTPPQGLVHRMTRKLKLVRRDFCLDTSDLRHATVSHVGPQGGCGGHLGGAQGGQQGGDQGQNASDQDADDHRAEDDARRQVRHAGVPAHRTPAHQEDADEAQNPAAR